MTIFELYVPIETPLRNERPFVYSVVPGNDNFADYWFDIFGAEDKEAKEAIHVASFVREGIHRYSKLASEASVILEERSFAWISPTIWIHIEHGILPIGTLFQYGKLKGFCKEGAVYVDDIYYAPLLDSMPSVSQTQDLDAYDLPAFVSGSAVLKCAGEELDWMIATPPIGYDCAIASLSGSTRDSISYLHSLYVENVTYAPSKVSLSLQDRRKAENIKIPTALFSTKDYPNIEENIVDKPIPWVFGAVRSLKPICTNGNKTSGVVTYRIAQSILSLGIVQIKKTVNDVDKWYTVTPITIDLAKGEFTLSSASGRSESGSRYECRVLNINTYPDRINEDNNPIIAGAQETSRIPMEDMCHIFYSANGGALYHAEAYDDKFSILSNISATDIDACRFPFVTYFDGVFLCLTHIVDQGPLYMYYSSDGVYWDIMNAGQPVLSNSSGILSHLWNPAFCVDKDGDTIHLVIECGVSADQSDVGLTYAKASYSELVASTGAFRFYPTHTMVIPGGGNPDIKAISSTELLVLCGSLHIEDDYWRIKAYFTDKVTGLMDASAWHKSEFFDISYPNMHTADPDLIAMPSTKAHKLLLGFMYNQENSYQCYFDLSAEEFFAWIKDGPTNTTAANAIRALNETYLGAQFVEGEYNTSEWLIAKSALSNIGIAVESQEELYSVIKRLQNGAPQGLRYEFMPDGRRTLRIDDRNREESFRITKESIKDISEIAIETDISVLAASIKVLYAKDYSEDEEREALYELYKRQVAISYRQAPQLSFTSLVQSQYSANKYAANKAELFKDIALKATLDICGNEYMGLRILDTGVVELIPSEYDADAKRVDGRTWFGEWRCMVLSIQPNPSTLTNTVTLLLVENMTDVAPLYVDQDTYLAIEGDTALLIGEDK